MSKKHYYSGKKILIIGRGISGMGAFETLKIIGANVSLYDDRYDKEYPNLNNLSLLVISPTVTMENPICVECIKKGIDIIGELELAYSISDLPIVAITGTNGKTTTTRMIGHILNNAKIKNTLAGNIGISASISALNNCADDVALYEVSSFQLMSIKKFCPHIAVITNISIDHLDIHKTFENYIDSKFAISKNQTQEDYLIINQDDFTNKLISDRAIKAIVLYTSAKIKTNGAYVCDNKIYYKDEFVCKLSDLRVQTVPFLLNSLNAIVVAKLFDVSNETILSSLNCFVVDKHRIEFILEFEGKKYYDDSKGTNIEATIKAIESMQGDTTLLLGGSDKGDSFDRLFASMDNKVKNIFAYGATKDKIINSSKKYSYHNITIANNLKDATFMASKTQVSNVLLSPACASFDEFVDYKDRGNKFCEYINEVINNEH